MLCRNSYFLASLSFLLLIPKTVLNMPFFFSFSTFAPAASAAVVGLPAFGGGFTSRSRVDD
jgi:hypothetical protein